MHATRVNNRMSRELRELPRMKAEFLATDSHGLVWSIAKIICVNLCKSVANNNSQKFA